MLTLRATMLRYLLGGACCWMAACSSSNSTGSPSDCSGWAQTSDCVATGPREPQNDQGCATPLSPGWSGYCECGSGHLGFDCGHVVITCSQVCSDAVQPAGTCIGWHQTSECAAAGPLEPQNDQDCSTPIQSSWSGYCECADRVVGFDCGHSVITCAEACASG